MALKGHDFAAPILRLDGAILHHYLPLPTEVADAFRAAGVRRLVGTLNGVPIRRAIQGRRNGERILIIGLDLLREIGAEYGDTVIAQLQPDPEPDRVDMPEELAIALEQDAEAGERFYGFTAGRRRGLALYVAQGKRPETRVARALEVAHKLRTRTLWPDVQGKS
jgi:hypothetical protein